MRVSWGGGMGWWPAMGIGPLAAAVLWGVCWHKSFLEAISSPVDCGLQHWVISGQTTNREGAQPHLSADNWIKDFLSRALPTRARPSFLHSQSLPLGSLHKPLILIHQRADRRSKNCNLGLQKENHNHRKLTKMITWITALCNSMKLRAMLCRAIQDGWVMVESFDKTWSTGEGNGKPLQYSCLENCMDSMKRQKDRTPEDEPFRSIGVWYATGEEQRNSSRKNEEVEPKQKQRLVVDVPGGKSKDQWCKEQYCTGTWNVRSMNQGKLDMVKKEMARVSIDILKISELKWTTRGEFNSDDH